MELFIFGRFHARAGCEDDLGEAVRKVVANTNEEAGCLGIHGFRSIRDPRLFYIHSRWVMPGRPQNPKWDYFSGRSARI